MSVGERIARTKLIIVEGIMGSGKSTTAKFITLQLKGNDFQARYFREADRHHPLRAMRELPHPRQPWLDFTPEEFAQSFMEKIHRRWQSFVVTAKQSQEIAVSDGYLFHGDMTLLFLMDTDRQSIIRHFERIVEISRTIHPILIYFYQANVEKTLRRVCDERGRKWEKYQVDWKIQSPYCQRRDLTGYNGLVQLYQAYRELTDQIYSRLDIKKIAIENSQGDWPRYCAQILEFLSLEYKQRDPESLTKGQICQGVIKAIHDWGTRLTRLWSNTPAQS